MKKNTIIILFLLFLLTPLCGFLPDTNPDVDKWLHVFSSTVTVIGAASGSVLKTISIGEIPTTIIITDDGKYAYVSGQGAGFIVLIDFSKNEFLTVIPVARNPITITEINWIITQSCYFTVRVL